MHRYIERFSKERDHETVVNAINNRAQGDGFIVQTLSSYPTINPVAIRVVNSECNPYVFLSGGVHGDEPAGVEALLKFLEEAKQHTTFNFLIIPCVNPVGYERNIREGSDFKDMNRNFYEGTPCHDNQVIMKFLAHAEYNYLFAMDLHETRANDKPNEEYPHSERHPESFYMFEVCDTKEKEIGQYITAEVSKVTPVCRWARVWGDTNINGVIAYPDAAHAKLYGEAYTFERYMHDNYTRHSFTTETYSGKYGGDGEYFNNRVQAQLTAVRSALRYIR